MTNKDLDYLQDAFNWNLNSYKLLNEKVKKIKKDDLYDTLCNAINICFKNMKDINNYLRECLNE